MKKTILIFLFFITLLPILADEPPGNLLAGYWTASIFENTLQPFDKATVYLRPYNRPNSPEFYTAYTDEIFTF